MARPLIEPDPAFLREVAEFRRDLHAHPELGFQEVRTAERVATALRAAGIEVAERVGGTGVVGTIRGRERSDKAIGLRADMDALSLEERTGLPYASRNAGIMHACGHDGHTAVLLGAARQLAANPDFAGTVQVIFQPAEEGLGGALAMIDDGLFERYPCDAVYALHTAPGLPVGGIATTAGALMAAAGTFRVVFTGAGGHAGQGAHLSADLTVAQANYVMALQTIVARDVPAVEPAVISVGYISGGDSNAPNVTPAEVSLGGTVRCFDTEIQALLDRRIDQIAQSVAATYGCDVTAQVTWITPPLVNAVEQTENAIRAARSAVGEDRVITSLPLITGGEDFAFMTQTKPGAIAFLGNGTAPDGTAHNVHTPSYDFNDDAIPGGIAFWVTLVHEQLAASPS
jgi:amidohydrolase